MLKAFYESGWFWPIVIVGLGYVRIHTLWHHRQVKKQLEKYDAVRGRTRPKRFA